MTTGRKKRIGVFVCHCGINIAGVVDVEKVAREMASYPDVVHSVTYVYMCSEPGQDQILKSVKEHDLDAVVVSACSPTLHEITFQRAGKLAGLNPYEVEIANIREQCSWVHQLDKEAATHKALEIVKTAVEKIRLSQALNPIQCPVDKKVMVIGGGISGIQAALDIANRGYQVVLVEREASLGGHVAEMSRAFLTLENTNEILAPKLFDVFRHPGIEVLSNAEVQEVTGYVGNFESTIRQKATVVDWSKCDGCRACLTACPVIIPQEKRKPPYKEHAIYMPALREIAARAVISRDECTHESDGCTACQEACPQNAIDYKQKDVLTQRQIGAIVVATGFGTYPKNEIFEYSGHNSQNVVDGLQFEQILNQWQSQEGPLTRPSDGKEIKNIVFVQCARSRDPEHGMSYCSNICCKYTAKQAKLFKKAVPNGEAYVFYIDVRMGGKENDEFYQATIAEEQLMYLRGKVSKIYEENQQMVVWGVDTLTGFKVEITADLVVLATAAVPNTGASELATILNIPTDSHGFFSEVHPKLRPVESPTAGIFLAGCARGPLDIPESITYASGAASKVMSLLANDEISHEPIVAYVDEDLCTGCGVCIEACPYGARVRNEMTNTAKVIEVLCQGCGGCIAACPNGACQQRNYEALQYFHMIDAIL